MLSRLRVTGHCAGGSAGDGAGRELAVSYWSIFALPFAALVLGWLVGSFVRFVRVRARAAEPQQD
jgi:hypothetical protein